MFDKFGEFDSIEEMNKVAADLKSKQDVQMLYELTKENGLDIADADDYMAGYVNELATSMSAAIGKINIEADNLKGLVEDWKNQIIQLCTEDKELCIAVRRKGKSLAECMAKLLKYSFDKKVKLDDRIVTSAGLKPPVYLGIPGKAEIRKIICEYYLEK